MNLIKYVVLSLAAATFAEAREPQVQTVNYQAVSEHYRYKLATSDYYTGFINSLSGRQDELSEKMKTLLLIEVDKYFKKAVGMESNAEIISLDEIQCERHQDNIPIYACATEITLLNTSISIEDEVLNDFLFKTFSFKNTRNHLLLNKVCDNTSAHCKLYTTMIYRKGV